METLWFILVVFVVSAANALNMTMVSELLERFAQLLASGKTAVLPERRTQPRSDPATASMSDSRGASYCL